MGMREVRLVDAIEAAREIVGGRTYFSAKLTENVLHHSVTLSDHA